MNAAAMIRRCVRGIRAAIIEILRYDGKLRDQKVADVSDAARTKLLSSSATSSFDSATYRKPIVALILAGFLPIDPIKVGAILGQMVTRLGISDDTRRAREDHRKFFDLHFWRASS